jgi:hypothetical protein
MSDTPDMTPDEGNAELTVNSAADAILGLMGGDEDSDGQSESQLEANDSDAESDEYDESEVEQEEADESEEPQRFRVKAAGEEREVTLDELIKSYQLGTDYTKKSQAVAEERKALRDQYAQRLEVMEKMLQPQDESENLAYLKETDPIGYSVKVAEMVERDKQLNAVRAERERIAQQQEHDRQQNLQRYVAEESQKLVAAVPEFADPAKGESLRKNIREFGKSLGFSDQELASVYDSRAVLTLYKAMQYDKLVASKPEITKKVSQAPKVIKPGVGNSRDTSGEELKKLKARAKQSGRVADAASVFEKFI